MNAYLPFQRVFQVRNVIFEEGSPHRTRLIDPVDDPFPQDPFLFNEKDVPVTPHPDPPPNQPELPPPLRRTQRVPKPTRAMLESQLSNQREAEALRAGKDLANDNAQRKCCRHRF